MLTHDLDTGGDPVGRLPEAVPKTLAAADHVRRCASAADIRRKAIDLLQAVASVECSFAVAGAGGVPAGLLRDLVLISGGLAGRPWLEANAERPAAAAFVALNVSRQPPPLPELDQILASLLWSRFSQQLAAAVWHRPVSPRVVGGGKVRPGTWTPAATATAGVG